LALAIDGYESYNQDQFTDALWSSITKLYGEQGASQVNLSLIHFNVEENIAVIRVNNTSVDMTRAALACLTNIAGKPAAVHVLRVSGTLKALHKKLNQ
jgi:RNase P/RNase MRP subunit POP5